LPLAALAIIGCGIVGVVLFRAPADQAAHSVLLKWNPPAPTPEVTIASYSIVRSTQSGGPYEEIASGIRGLSYTDHAVSRQKTYYYRVRAVDTSGRMSPPSEEVSAAVP
jgi:fibronectin type 3 domain-containing protein